MSDSFVELEELIAKHASPGIRPGLDRIMRLLSLLGDPQGAYPAVHVVGTNGKGSTCAMLNSVFREAGRRTALYTSPHLESPGERLLIDGRPLSPIRWKTAAERVLRALSADSTLRSDPPSYFELVTAMAFLLAAEEKTEIAVIEAGLGGRLDATNLLSNVVCSVICSISMDHTEYLGDTLEKIAAEKFAVVRGGTPACFLGDRTELIPLFEEFCARVGAFPFIVGRDALVSPAELSEEGCVFDFSASGLNLPKVRTGLIGGYQVSNAALALLTLSRLRERFPWLSESVIRAGLQKARWPGRFEILSCDGERPILVLDGGHNPDGVEKFAESLASLWGDKKIGIVYGVMKDKDYPACLGILNGLKEKGSAPALYATCVPGMERSLKPGALAEYARQMSWRNEVDAYDDPLDAIDRAREENDVVVVCGSLYLIGWVRPRLRSGGDPTAWRVIAE
ncbi:MAG: bifunctional folylpolyglutamate synthase/dihydrofolate synthase [Synergistaceae bacterium]|nr:bifunctional folylpolyglutamate synthase/dihydrofolate synthase [Synergistaceae bacterium]